MVGEEAVEAEGVGKFVDSNISKNEYNIKNKGGNMSAQHFTNDNFSREVIESKKPALVDFYAQWCGPCQMASPIIDKFAEEFKDKVVIGKVDVDEARDLAQKHEVMSIPTIIVFKDGKEIDRKVGFPGEAGLRNLIEKIL